jgi:signal transduction histidine kinase
VTHAFTASRREILFDVAAVVGAIAVGLVTMLLPKPILEPHGGVTVVGLSVLSLTLLLRRRLPVTLAWFTAGMIAAVLCTEAVEPGILVPRDLGADFLPWVPPFAPFVAYALTAFAGDRRAAWPPGVTLLILATRPWAGPSEHITQGLMLIAVPELLGLYVAARRRLFKGLIERAERAEREQHLLAEQARADERARFAAELHDIVSHRVSLMVLQAGTLSMTTGEEAVRVAAEGMRLAGCQALEELRDLVGLLRTASDGTVDGMDPVEAISDQAPAPAIGPLLAESESVGVPVELTEEGDRSVMALVVGRAVYRVVQEALTNVHRHAPGATVQVWVSYTKQDVRVSVRNDAPKGDRDAALAAAGSGTGLLGLRERVEMLGGTFVAGPDGDGFLVDARLPASVMPVRAGASS